MGHGGWRWRPAAGGSPRQDRRRSARRAWRDPQGGALLARLSEPRQRLVWNAGAGLRPCGSKPAFPCARHGMRSGGCLSLPGCDVESGSQAGIRLRLPAAGYGATSARFTLRRRGDASSAAGGRPPAAERPSRDRRCLHGPACPPRRTADLRRGSPPTRACGACRRPRLPPCQADRAARYASGCHARRWRETVEPVEGRRRRRRSRRLPSTPGGRR